MDLNLEEIPQKSYKPFIVNKLKMNMLCEILEKAIEALTDSEDKLHKLNVRKS
jgi:hypothetical protein|tara:strand:- start:12713 stop:12871 length:159 start_codon:yes stop_codon:yes gene_type:complete